MINDENHVVSIENLNDSFCLKTVKPMENKVVSQVLFKPLCANFVWTKPLCFQNSYPDFQLLNRIHIIFITLGKNLGKFHQNNSE